MANFKIAETGEDISWFDLPLNRKIKLMQWGGDAKGDRLDVALDRSVANVDLTILPDKAAAASTLFTLSGSAAGTSFSVAAYLPDGSRMARYSQDLAVRVCGQPIKQPGYAVDLVSDLAISGTPKQVYLYSRIFRGPADDRNVLSQDTRPGHYNCGDVAAAYGVKIFSKPTVTAYFTYYIPLKQTDPSVELKMDDLRFNADRVRQGVAKIKSYLSTGTPVRVWMIHHDGFKSFITGDWRSHFLTIVGYSANKFLYLDPWPHGSRLDYDGGMYAKTRNVFMGELEYDMSHLELGIGSSSGKLGLHDYKVIAGP
ncbi:hypothetical protein [Methylocella silvestris]|uniref:Uncharacterized protein n=1 Tax=Methylocella silvestris TaxID=199596 RepID=A0A2J7TH44_METSI|nr:hypothetical protein [Methylocella silvestris]PNG26093.1 hypothetical protein CR492_09565 [Methylocella silvestris]